MEPLRFIGIGDLLVELGTSIGSGSKALVTNSASRLGTLTVRTVDVDLSFEMSSNAINNTLQIDNPLATVFGAKTLSISSGTTQETQTNRCTIKLQIVNVADMPQQQPQQPQVPAVQPAQPSPTADEKVMRAELEAALKAAEGVITRANLDPNTRAALETELNSVAALLQANNIAGAEAALAQFLARHLGTRQPQPGGLHG